MLIKFRHKPEPYQMSEDFTFTRHEREIPDMKVQSLNTVLSDGKSEISRSMSFTFQMRSEDNITFRTGELNIMETKEVEEV